LDTTPISPNAGRIRGKDQSPTGIIREETSGPGSFNALHKEAKIVATLPAEVKELRAAMAKSEKKFR
jgi:hypothetical protein